MIERTQLHISIRCAKVFEASFEEAFYNAPRTCTNIDDGSDSMYPIILECDNSINWRDVNETLITCKGEKVSIKMMPKKREKKEEKKPYCNY